MRLLYALSSLATVMPAMAQTVPNGQPDNAAIMKALEAITDRLDRLEKRDNPRKPATAAGGGQTKKVPPAEPAGKSEAGWYVHLVPWTEDPNATMAIGGFAGPHFEFNFDQHTRYNGDHTRYIYNGKSFFHPQEAGNYVFSIVLEPITAKNIATGYTEVCNCSGELLIGGNRILAGATNYEQLWAQQKDFYRSQAIYGQVQLEKKPYRAEFRVDCWPIRGKSMPTFDTTLPVWKQNRFKILVKSPADSAVRPLLGQEIYYVGIP